LSKYVFFLLVAALAFVPGGIYVSIFLLALYCFVLPHLNGKKGRTAESAAGRDPPGRKDAMSRYSVDTLDEMR